MTGVETRLTKDNKIYRFDPLTGKIRIAEDPDREEFCENNCHIEISKKKDADIASKKGDHRKRAHGKNYVVVKKTIVHRRKVSKINISEKWNRFTCST